MLARHSLRICTRIPSRAIQAHVQSSSLALKSNSILLMTPSSLVVRSFSTGLVRWQQQAQQQHQPPMNVTEEDQQKNKKPTTDPAKDMKLDENPVATKDQQPTSYLGKLYQQSKELVVFYKDGLKLLWSNNKTSKALKQKVQHEGYVLTRSEFQLIHHNKIDMLKLIPFSVIFLVLPESIPFFVVFAPGVIPSTCVKESQVYKQRQKLDKLRQTMSANVLKSAENVKGIAPADFLSISKFSKIAKHYEYDFEFDQIDRTHLAAYCRFMGLNGYGTRGMLRKRLDKHFDYLNKDDKLISNEGVDSLTLFELQRATEERGMRSIDLDQNHLQQGLKYWIASQSIDPPIARGLLVFSRMFLLNANYK